MRQGTGWAAGSAICALACGLAACGGSGAVSSAASPAGTAPRVGTAPSATGGAPATGTGAGAAAGSSVVSGFAVVNTDAAARAAVRAAVGRSQCAVRQAGGVTEVGLWDPASRVDAVVIKLRTEQGHAQITTSVLRPGWRPAGGPNCTVTASGTVVPF